MGQRVPVEGFPCTCSVMQHRRGSGPRSARADNRTTEPRAAPCLGYRRRMRHPKAAQIVDFTGGRRTARTSVPSARRPVTLRPGIPVPLGALPLRHRRSGAEAPHHRNRPPYPCRFHLDKEDQTTKSLLVIRSRLKLRKSFSCSSEAELSNSETRGACALPCRVPYCLRPNEAKRTSHDRRGARAMHLTAVERNSASAKFQRSAASDEPCAAVRGMYALKPT
jgi:hypothetical protein